jgi:hypothetical protein
MSFAQLSRTSPRPEGVTFRNQSRPNTPADLFSATSQGQTSTTRTTDPSTWVQPVGATAITLEDVQSLMQIQAKQFQQSMMDRITQVQTNVLDITDELRSDQNHAVQSLRSSIRREMEQTSQNQEQLMHDQGVAIAELSRMLREDILPTLRARNVQTNVPATPAQARPQDQQPTTQANLPATPAQLPTGQQPPVTPAQDLLATTTDQRNPYESMMAQAQQVSSRNHLSYTGPPPAFYVPGTPRIPSVSATMGNEPVYLSRPLYSFQSFQSASTPIRGHGHGHHLSPRHADQSATPHPVPNATNINPR